MQTSLTNLTNKSFFSLTQLVVRNISGKHVNIRSKFVPRHKEATNEDVEIVQKFIESRNRLFVLSGAGISTESGLPDYRSKKVGLYERSKHKPMLHQDFISSKLKRKKYWARNYAGWSAYQKIRPNTIHYKLTHLQQEGKVLVHVTQNVDGLNQKAGGENIVELHGAMGRVKCLNCGEIVCRDKLQSRFKEMNKHWSADVIDIRPDADANISDDAIKHFCVPDCECCGGTLKPDVVFFGDNVRRSVVEDLYSKLEDSDGVLVCGSSLFVWSGYRFIRQAHVLKIPVMIINIGQTRADDLCDFKIDASVSDILSRITIG